MATYFVGKNGNDSNNGSQLSPWLTIQHAADIILPGDTLYVRGGTYYGWVLIITHSGLAGSPITFKAYPNEYPLIDGSPCPTPSSSIGLVTVNQSYINIDGLEVANSPASIMFHGVLLSGAPDHVGLLNLKVHNVYHDGVVLWEATNVLLDGCEIHDVDQEGGDEGLSITASNFEMRNCKIYNVVNGEINIIASSPAKFGCNNISIHDNEIYNSLKASAIYIDCQGINQSNILIYANRIHDCGNGIAMASEISPATLSGVDICNNLIYNNTVGATVWPYNFPKTFKIINNTFYNNFVGVDINDAAQYMLDCAIRNNIVVNLKNTNVLINTKGGVSIDHNLFYQPPGINTIYGTDYVIGDPLFLNPASFDFHLQPGSPAINVGSPTDAPTDDFEGKPRPYGIGFDIGAYEYVAASGFQHGTLYTASFQITENPHSEPCQFELWLGLNTSTKLATAGKVNFTSGANVPVTCSITMPAAGTYNVYVDIYMLGVFIERFTSSTVTVV